MEQSMEQGLVTQETVRKYYKVEAFLEAANEQMSAIGYTEHGFRHAAMVAERARALLVDMDQEPRICELTGIAGYLHDIGNAVNRNSHPETSAIIAMSILTEMGLPITEIVQIVAAIGNHEEGGGAPVSAASAALIIADKSDVHHSRVQNQNPLTFDIHDRVNFSVQKSHLRVDKSSRSINLELDTDEHSASVMEYFEIFLSRMLMCRRAADYFGYKFKLIINDVDM